MTTALLVAVASAAVVLTVVWLQTVATVRELHADIEAIYTAMRDDAEQDINLQERVLALIARLDALEADAKRPRFVRGKRVLP